MSVIILDSSAEQMQKAQNLTRDNHFVQQALTRRWSPDWNRVFLYRTLVSQPSINEWDLKSIKGTGEQRNLYTTFLNGRETDEFEHWLQREYEDPGIAATEKMISGARLHPSDWEAAQRYVAAQDVRTPLTFLETMQRWGQELVPERLTEVLAETIKEMQARRAAGGAFTSISASNFYAESIKVRIERSNEPATAHAEAQLSVKAGRRLWIQRNRQVLTDNAAVICAQRWSIVEPYGDEEWPLTDQPVLRLNWYKPGHYDFGGGWGIENSEIMMPISPRHLLYVKVGCKLSNRFTLPLDYTRQLQRFIVERAYRHIFASKPLAWVSKARPREVNADRFNAEQQAWKAWHNKQLQFEMAG